MLLLQPAGAEKGCPCVLLLQVLKEAARVCKPDGRIILMEHGEGSYAWINRLLDGVAEKHKAKWGCWFNRDIMAIIQEVGRQAGGGRGGGGTGCESCVGQVGWQAGWLMALRSMLEVGGRMMSHGHIAKWAMPGGGGRLASDHCVSAC